MCTKKRICLLFVTLFSCFGNAQIVSFKYDLFGLLPRENKIIRPSVELAFSKHFSFGFAYELGQFKVGHITINDGDPIKVYHSKGWGLMPEFRYYPFTKYNKAPVGFFVGTYYRHRFETESYYGPDETVPFTLPLKTINFNTDGISRHFGGAFGSKMNLGVFVFEWLIGIGGGKTTWETPNERFRIPPTIAGTRNTEFSFRAEISLGFVFPKPKTAAFPDSVYSIQTPGLEFRDVARVIIYRTPKLIGEGFSYKLFANDSLITTIKTRFYYEFVTTPGTVTFRAKTEATKTITFELERGRTYYLKCGVGGGIFIPQPRFAIMKPITAEKEIKKVKEKLKL